MVIWKKLGFSQGFNVFFLEDKRRAFDKNSEKINPLKYIKFSFSSNIRLHFEKDELRGFNLCHLEKVHSLTHLISFKDKN